MVESDLEGPWVKADHAFDVTSKAIPNGDRLFQVLSAYDDYRFFVEKADGYEPGDTLMLIAPFLVAFGADDAFLREVARSPENTSLIDGAREAIRYLQEIEDFFLISTSYEQYVGFAAELLGVPRDNVFCTSFPIDELSKEVEESDKKMVREWARRIQRMPVIQPSSDGQLSPDCLRAKEEIDGFFWNLLPKTSFSSIMRTVRPVGGGRKYQALQQALEKQGRGLSEAAVIGDSITDSVMLEKVREAGGLALSFNGSRYAIRCANVAVISDNCLVTAAVVETYRRSGLDTIREISEGTAGEGLGAWVSGDHLSDRLRLRLTEAFSGTEGYPRIYWIDETNLDEVVRLSEAFRKKVRGTAIGQLG